MRKWRRNLKLLATQTGTLGMLRWLRDRLWPPTGPDYPEIAKTGAMPLPSTATFEPTIGCNLHCPMCYQNDMRAGPFRDSPTQQVISLMDRLSGQMRFVYLIGGEIFLRKDIFNILNALEQQKIEFFITSNGTLLNTECIQRLAQYRMLVGLGVSLDGTEAVHDSIRGPGTFRKSIAALSAAAPLFRVGVNSVLMPENLLVASDLMRVVAGVGVREINFSCEIFCSEEDVAKTARALKIDHRAVAMETKPVTAAIPAEDEILRLVDTLDRLGRELGMIVTFEPPVPREYLGSLFGGTIQEATTVICREMTNLRIDPNGNVLPCGFLRKPFGNVFEQSVEEIWNGEEFRQFRRMLLAGNLLPACKRCCKLGVVMEHGRPAKNELQGNYH